MNFTVRTRNCAAETFQDVDDIVSNGPFVVLKNGEELVALFPNEEILSIARAEDKPAPPVSTKPLKINKKEFLKK